MEGRVLEIFSHYIVRNLAGQPSQLQPSPISRAGSPPSRIIPQVKDIEIITAHSLSLPAMCLLLYIKIILPLPPPLKSLLCLVHQVGSSSQLYIYTSLSFMTSVDLVLLDLIPSRKYSPSCRYMSPKSFLLHANTARRRKAHRTGDRLMLTGSHTSLKNTL